MGHITKFRDFKIKKSPHILNPVNNYEFQDDYYIIWDNGNIGAYQFLTTYDEKIYYGDITDEWEEFYNTLLSYNPLDYDKFNNYIVFNIETGKKVLDDYPSILFDTNKKIKNKIAKLRLRDAKINVEKLSKEINNDN